MRAGFVVLVFAAGASVAWEPIAHASDEPSSAAADTLPAAAEPRGRLTVAVITDGSCSGTKTTTYQCREWVCTGGTWEMLPKPAGTPCSDGNPCTYGDVCDGGVACRGTLGCIPAGPCEICNGTQACGKAAAGTPCPSSPEGNPCEAVCDGTSIYCQPL